MASKMHTHLCALISIYMVEIINTETTIKRGDFIVTGNYVLTIDRVLAQIYESRVTSNVDNFLKATLKFEHSNFVQVWQWIRHQARLEDNNKVITMAMVEGLVQEVVRERLWAADTARQFASERDRARLYKAARMFEEIVTKRDFPEFITTYLNLDHTFLDCHSQPC